MSKNAHRLVFRLKDFARLPFLKSGQELVLEVEHRCDIAPARAMKVRLRRAGNEIELFDPEDRG